MTAVVGGETDGSSNRTSYAPPLDGSIEIFSPSETAQMIHEKVADYLRADTQLLWVVYPAGRTHLSLLALVPEGEFGKAICHRYATAVFGVIADPETGSRSVLYSNAFALVYPASQTVMVYRPPRDARCLTVEDDLEGGDVVSKLRYSLKHLFA